jgi:hypothetical protein
MNSSESLQPKDAWAERAPRETVAENMGKPLETREREVTPENEGITEEELGAERLTAFLDTMPSEKLTTEQERLQRFIDAVQGDQEDLADLAPESAAMAQELIKEELALLEAIKIQLVKRKDVLGKIPKVGRIADDVALPYAATELPPRMATVAPPKRKARGPVSPASAPTEYPKDLPN